MAALVGSRHTALASRVRQKLEGLGCTMESTGNVNGMLDYVVCVPGNPARYAEIDIKVDRDELKPGQRARIHQLRAKGAIADEVRSVESALDLLDLK